MFSPGFFESIDFSRELIMRSIGKKGKSPTPDYTIQYRRLCRKKGQKLFANIYNLLADYIKV